MKKIDENSIQKVVISNQIKASIKVNSELLQFYWYLGQKIIEVQKEYKWGSKFLENLSKDLSREFPDVKGFSKRNLELIRKWVKFWDHENTKQLVSQLFQIPWGHNIVIIQKCKNLNEALFYVQNTIKHGISRKVYNAKTKFWHERFSSRKYS